MKPSSQAWVPLGLRPRSSPPLATVLGSWVSLGFVLRRWTGRGCGASEMDFLLRRECSGSPSGQGQGVVPWWAAGSGCPSWRAGSRCGDGAGWGTPGDVGWRACSSVRCCRRGSGRRSRGSRSEVVGRPAGAEVRAGGVLRCGCGNVKKSCPEPGGAAPGTTVARCRVMLLWLRRISPRGRRPRGGT